MLCNAMLFQLNSVMEFLKMVQLVQSCEGYLLPAEGHALMLLAEQGPGVGEIVEIGSFKGLSTCWLAMGSKLAGREPVTAVDTFKGSEEHQKGGSCEATEIAEGGSTYETFEANLTRVGLRSRVNPIIAPSEQAAATWERPIRLLFIDAGHRYEDVKNDLECWQPHVVDEGVIALHDVGNWPGPTQLLDEITAPGGGYREVLRVQALAVVSRDRQD